jgi:hypothetical protein
MGVSLKKEILRNEIPTSEKAIPIYEILRNGNVANDVPERGVFSEMSLFPTFEKSAVSEQIHVTFFSGNPLY